LLPTLDDAQHRAHRRVAAALLNLRRNRFQLGWFNGGNLLQIRTRILFDADRGTAGFRISLAGDFSAGRCGAVAFGINLISAPIRALAARTISSA
jgi:hypothetical protein